MATREDVTRQRYQVAAIYAMDAIKYYLVVAPNDNSPYALVSEVLTWASGGKATWESVERIAMIVRIRHSHLSSLCDQWGLTTGALVAAKLALETVLLLVDTPAENLLEATWKHSRQTKDALNALFKNGVVQGAVNFLQKLPPHPV